MLNYIMCEIKFFVYNWITIQYVITMTICVLNRKKVFLLLKLEEILLLELKMEPVKLGHIVYQH